jgi:hypothetical protein
MSYIYCWHDWRLRYVHRNKKPLHQNMLIMKLCDSQYFTTSKQTVSCFLTKKQEHEIVTCITCWYPWTLHHGISQILTQLRLSQPSWTIRISTICSICFKKSGRLFITTCVWETNSSDTWKGNGFSAEFKISAARAGTLPQSRNTDTDQEHCHRARTLPQSRNTATEQEHCYRPGILIRAGILIQTRNTAREQEHCHRAGTLIQTRNTATEQEHC